MKKGFFALLLLIIPFLPGTASSKVYIDLDAPSVKRLPVAIQEFRYSGVKPAGKEEAALIESAGKELYDALKGDLEFSRLFTVVPKGAHLEDPAKSGITLKETDFPSWRTIGADTLVKGSFTIEGGNLVLEAHYYDCVKESEILARRYLGGSKNPRRVAHYLADQIYEEITGRKGVFSTRMLFVSARTGNKEVYISDYDGKNTVQVTKNGSINLSPQWMPDGRSIIYTSYKLGRPSLFMLDLTTGKDTLISDRPGINIGARPSPSGTEVALTLSIDKSPELYLLKPGSGDLKRLTDNHGIDVSPSWSPDGRKMVYVSDKAGNPHIFMLDLSTGKETRLTFEGKYNSSPAWSPDGALIAFSRSDAGRFNIWVMRPDGSAPRQLTFEGDNRSPSWSPDGRFIVFSSNTPGISSLFIMQSDGTGLTKIQTGAGGEKSPAWSPRLY